ncbi:MAG: RNA polymerase sigma factor [Halocynthiibacter sp.]
MDMPYDGHDETSDETLLALYGSGDRAAARTLTLRLTPKVFGYSARLLQDAAEAEDVTQEAMLRLWRVAKEWREGEAKITTWLYRVVTNLCTDRLRKRRPVGLDQIAEPEDPGPDAAAALQNRARLGALDAALANLPDRQRTAVVLRHIEGLANPEIGQIMDISTEAVESLTARGKRALVASLAGRKEELGYGDG